MPKKVKKPVVRKKAAVASIPAAIPVPAPITVKKVHKEKKEKVIVPKYYGTGRRKTSVARVYLVPGTGKILVNNRTFENYICGRKLFEISVEKPLRLTSTFGRYDVLSTIAGGGIASQMGALRHGISRALIVLNPDFRKVLKKGGFLTRDPRMKERKKYGQKRARKRFQYTKR